MIFFVFGIDFLTFCYNIIGANVIYMNAIFLYLIYEFLNNFFYINNYVYKHNYSMYLLFLDILSVSCLIKQEINVITSRIEWVVSFRY